MRNETMTLGFEEFCDFVRDNILSLMPEDRKRTVRIMDVDKNNGIKRKGISITGEEGNISPTIYLEGFYEDFASRLCSAVEKGVLIPLTDKYSAETVTLEAETCVSVCTSDEISTYTDVRHYADRTLVTLLRRSQSWQRTEAVSHHRKEVSWLLCGLPKLSPEVKKAAKTAGVMPPDGFYATDGKTVLYRCFFKEGDGAGLRRSAEKRFISEYAFDRRGDITQNR